MLLGACGSTPSASPPAETGQSTGGARCDGKEEGPIDCTADGCAGKEVCAEHACANGKDDDGDGLVDCDDPDCSKSDHCRM